MKKSIILLVLISLFSLQSCTKNNDNIVTYHVSSLTRGFTVTYLDKNENEITIEEPGKQWELQFYAEPGQKYLLIATAKSEKATISTRVSYNRRRLSNPTANGDFATAKSSGTLPRIVNDVHLY